LLLTEAVALGPAGISILAKYSNPPTPMAVRHTSVAATGHILLGVAAAPAGFFLNCGTA
jgi:hypothetical protein